MRAYILILAFLGSGCTSAIYLDQKSKFPDYITTALTYTDKSETTHRDELREFLNVDPVRTEWCAAFINSILNQHGISGSESISDVPLMARSFLHWGQEIEPSKIKFGDVIVFPRGNQGWQGHVGFYVGTEVVNGKEYYIILGGNQDNKVSIELFPATRAIGIRRHN